MRRLWTAVAIAALLLTACGREGGRNAAAERPGTSSTKPADTTKRPERPTVRAAASPVSLERFDACPSLVTHLRAEALKRVGPYGLPGGFGDVRAVAMPLQADASTSRSAAAEGGAAAPAPAYSSTNVQETNVDEPDVIKTNGTHIFTLRPEPGSEQRQRLTSISIDGGPTIAGGVLLPEAFGYELLLAGDRLLAMGQKGGYGVPYAEDARVAGSFPAPMESGTVIAIVDVSDPADLRITHKLELDGTYASARMVGGVARLVVNSQSSKIAFAQPQQSTVGAEKKALEINKKKIRDAGIDKWLPRFKLQDASGKLEAEGPLTSCSSTFHPQSFSGFGEVSVVTIDPRSPDPRESAAVIGAAGTVYASTANLYVATQQWPEAQPVILRDQVIGAPAPMPAPAKTALHRFDIADPARAVYAASGEVRGIVLNQWSLSEHEGHLRVATTEERFKENAPAQTSSFVTVLDAKASKLERVGGIDDISPGERIYGVRFMGDLGYMVTFRQIDPLHVIDLSVPDRPRLLGELKIPGYSAYLHPVGDGLLLGVGRDADLEGRPLGVSLSLFDVRDSANPTRLDVLRLDDTYSPVEYDHHAFTWWAPSTLAIVPVELQNVVAAPEGKAEPSSFAYGFRITDGAITKTGRISHGEHLSEPYTGQITRSIVIGDAVYTLSSAGIAVSDLDSFAERGWLALR